jgi:hypothetical protein
MKPRHPAVEASFGCLAVWYSHWIQSVLIQLSKKSSGSICGRSRLDRTALAGRSRLPFAGNKMVAFGRRHQSQRRHDPDLDSTGSFATPATVCLQGLDNLAHSAVSTPTRTHRTATAPARLILDNGRRTFNQGPAYFRKVDFSDSASSRVRRQSDHLARGSEIVDAGQALH